MCGWGCGESGEDGWHQASPGLDEINWVWRTLTRWRRRRRSSCLSHSSLQPTGFSLAARSPGGLSVRHFISKRLIPSLSPQRSTLSNKADSRREICESYTWFPAARSNLPHEINATVWSKRSLFGQSWGLQGDEVFWSFENFSGLFLLIFYFYFFLHLRTAFIFLDEKIKKLT